MFCLQSPVFVNGGKATIYAQIPGGNKVDKITPGCVLQAKWPESYGDVFLGADNCIYDARGKSSYRFLFWEWMFI